MPTEAKQLEWLRTETELSTMSRCDLLHYAQFLHAKMEKVAAKANQECETASVYVEQAEKLVDSVISATRRYRISIPR